MKARRVALLVALGVFVLHLSVASRYGWFRDELYYVACARRLAWGYVDHPPLVAVIARVAVVLFGESLVGLRLFAALAAAGTALLAAELARVMGGDRFAEGLAAFAVAAAPYDLVVGHIYTMNGFEPLFWCGAALLVARALDGRSTSLVWLGPIVGLALLNKHSSSWMVAGLFLGVLVSPSRRLLVRRDVLLAAAIATLIVLPHVVWQAANHFPTREFAKGALSGKNEPYGPLGFLSSEIQLMHPLSAPLWMGGLAALLAWKPLARFRPLGIAWLFVAVLVAVTQAKPYYVGPAFPILMAAGAVLFEKLTASGARAARPAYLVVLAAGALALLPMTLPVLSVPAFQRYFAALGGFGEAKSGERMAAAALPQTYADMHGWPELADSVASVVESLPAEDRASYFVLAGNYGKASAVEMFGRRRSIGPVASGDNGWWLWGPPRPDWPNAVVAVGVSRSDLGRLFDDVREVARADHPLARADERDTPIYVCHGPRPSLAEAWPTLKHYR